MRFLKFGKVAGAVVAGAAVATVLAAPAASAAPVAPAAASALSYPDECFGYWGEFKDGTIVEKRQWRDGSQECFGIAPDRTIWHAWPNSGGWRQMPGNGRADRIENVLENGFGDRMVVVFVFRGSTFWCNTNPQGGASWGGWVQC